MANADGCPIVRTDFFCRLNESMAACHAAGQMLGLLVIDINRFSRINTSFGYRTGDDLLAAFSQRLHAACRIQDRASRIGDNRFAIILSQLIGEGQLILAANKLINSVKEAFELESGTVFLDAAIGMAICPEHAADAEMLLLKAEHALAGARHGGVPYQLYSESESNNITFGWNIEKELDEALENNELDVYFQPKISLISGDVCGAEALVRWSSPTRGPISPDVFIAIAEQTGRIQQLTQWVLNTALHRALAWPGSHGDLSVAVNLSAKIAHDEELGELVQGAISLWGIASNRVIIEITENELMRDPEGSYIMLAKLQAQGIRISIDDFGTGYSSLAYFKRLPASELKIDKTFVLNMLENDGDREIVRLAIHLAHSFGFQVVAEGVEDHATLRALAQMGCDYAQGFYIALPMPQPDYIAWLDRFEAITL